MIVAAPARQALEHPGLVEATTVVESRLEAAAQKQLPYADLLADLLASEATRRARRGSPVTAGSHGRGPHWEALAARQGRKASTLRKVSGSKLPKFAWAVALSTNTARFLPMSSSRTHVTGGTPLAIWASRITTMAGIKVMAKVTYCGHSLQAEAELNRHGEWIGQCVVEGRVVKRTLMLHTPLRTPTAALDAILSAGRRWVDESVGTVREGESP
jgi:hypothetical protein